MTFSPRAAVSAAILIVCLLLVAPVAAVWTPETIAPSNPQPIAADIADSNVVYSVAYGDAMNMSAPRGLLLCDITTGTTTKLANASSPYTLTGGMIAGDLIVWFEEPQAFLNESVAAGLTNRIMLHSLGSGTTSDIFLSPSAEWPKTDGRRVIWSATPNGSYTQYLTLYDPDTGTLTPLPVHPDDGSDVVFDGDTIAFRDAHTFALSLYDIPSNATRTILTPVRTNITETIVDTYAMWGDLLLYKTRVVEFSPSRSIYSTLTRYDCATNTSTLVSPITGKPIPSLNAEERKASFDSLFTDGITFGWSYETGISESDLITVDAGTGAVSHLTIDGDIAFPAIDGNRAVWVQSKLFKDSHVVLATCPSSPKGEDATTPVPTKAAAPFFGMLCATGACAALFYGRRE